GPHAAVVAAQVAIEVGVEPEALAEGTRRLVFTRRIAVPEDPAGPSALRRDGDDGIARHARPGLEVAPHCGAVTDDRHEVTSRGLRKGGDDIEQEPAREGPPPAFDLDPRLERHIVSCRRSARSESRLAAPRRVVKP